MTDPRHGTAHQRTYIRVVNDQTHTAYINVGTDGKVHITADNLHALLLHMGYTETNQEPTP